MGHRQPWEDVDLIVRVFREKLKELLDDIQHKGVLGSVKGIIWVIEYQKRGLPHAHILVILHNKDKARYLNFILNISYKLIVSFTK